MNAAADRNPSVTLINIGTSNLHSVTNALTQLGASVSIAMHGEEIKNAERLILPGVGTFRDGMERLERLGFVGALQQHQKRGTPVLGICLGMQLLFTDGSEFGPCEGLDLIPGHVRPIPKPALRRSPVKIPHVGWDQVQIAGFDSGQAHPLFDGLENNFYAYFLHSFHAQPKDSRAVLASCQYGPHSICAVARRGSIFGTQFHPEKSGALGLRLLANFMNYRATREETENAPDSLSRV